MTTAFDQLTDEQLRDAERELANRKREREYAKWDAELVGRYFCVIRAPQPASAPHIWLPEFPRLGQDDYVTLERTLGVGGVDKFGHSTDYVYADVVYINIQSRDDGTLMCSGFEVSHERREECYLKIQPVFYSYDDFRKYLNSQRIGSAPTKHFDEISKEDYEAALSSAVSNFMAASTTKAEGTKGC